MIPVINKILFATDLSETARPAFGYAVAVADRFESELEIVHVIKENTGFSKGVAKIGLGDSLYKKLEKEKNDSARDAMIGKKSEALTLVENMRALCREAEACLTRTTPMKINESVVTASSVSEEILCTVDEARCDLIVIGHRKGILASVKLGEGTLKKVLRKATVPVLVVPPLNAEG